jgi:hypothetical protein
LRESTLDSENESNPTSEEDTANGAELNEEPTHNSNETDSRRCSENESNPTNEGDTATGAELSEEPTHHNSNGTESRKRDDDAVTQAECSASKRAKFEPPNEIVVEGSSMSQVNGVYKRNADYNYAPQYCKQGVYGGSNATYRIYRTQWRGWCIGAKYHCSVLYYTTTSLMLPPIDGWFACGGRKAAPTLVYNQSYMQPSPSNLVKLKSIQEVYCWKNQILWALSVIWKGIFDNYAIKLLYRRQVQVLPYFLTSAR